MEMRSKKYGAVCDITVEELRKLMYKFYNTPCRYCSRVLTVDNMVFDHIMPVSKQGASSVSNLQLICKTCNGMKGSLVESNFMLLIEWLSTVPEELKKDITVRLSRGIY